MSKVHVNRCDANSFDALRLLLNYVNTRVPKTYQEIAAATEDVGASQVSVETIKRWTKKVAGKHAKKKPPEQNEFEAVARAVYRYVRQASPGHPIHAVAAYVYGEAQPAEQAVVKNSWICQTRWPWPPSERDHPRSAEQLYGLHFLIRPSTETVQHRDGQQRGLSLALLNVIPHYVQQAAAPLFRLRQRNLTGTASDIAGSITCQDGAFLLSGVGYTENGGEASISPAPFFASIAIGADINEYRSEVAAGSGPVQLRGQMHGRSISAGAIATAFRTIYIPKSFVNEARLPHEAADSAFYKLNKQAERVTGVYHRDSLNEALSASPFSIALAARDLDEMWDRAREARINHF